MYAEQREKRLDADEMAKTNQARDYKEKIMTALADQKKETLKARREA